MAELELVVLSLVQGVTEFLPISSSGHLVLVREVFGWSRGAAGADLVLDVGVHVGTLGAVVVYFRRDVWGIAHGAAGLFAGRRDSGARLALFIVAATVPVLIGGAAVKAFGTDAWRTPIVIGATTLGFGVVLYAADRIGRRVRRLEHMTLGNAVLIGLAQVLALVPGTSRAGITMTAARALGYERADAARFSMLLSIPVILAAGTVEGLELYRADAPGLAADVVAATALAFVFALGAIGFLMRWLERASFTPFVVYRLALGGAVLLWV